MYVCMLVTYKHNTSACARPLLGVPAVYGAWKWLSVLYGCNARTAVMLHMKIADEC